MALCAGEMVVVFVATADTVVMCPIRKLDPGEQSHIHQLFTMLSAQEGILDEKNALPHIFYTYERKK